MHVFDTSVIKIHFARTHTNCIRRDERVLYMEYGTKRPQPSKTFYLTECHITFLNHFIRIIYITLWMNINNISFKIRTSRESVPTLCPSASFSLYSSHSLLFLRNTTHNTNEVHAVGGAREHKRLCSRHSLVARIYEIIKNRMHFFLVSF